MMYCLPKVRKSEEITKSYPLFRDEECGFIEDAEMSCGWHMERNPLNEHSIGQRLP